MTLASGSSSCGERTMIARAVCGATIARSRMSIGLPVRHTTRSPRRSPVFARMASSISTLSSSARMTTTGSRALSLAMASSPSTVKTVFDQPRISVCPRSSTAERPLRSSWRRWSTLVARMPMNALKMTMPPKVRTSWSAMKAALEVSSPATVPASMTCRRAL